MKYLQTFTELGILSIGVLCLYQLIKINKGVILMTEKEQELDDAIAAVVTTSQQGFRAISDAVTSAADRVVKALEDSDVDLSDEIESINALKTSVSDAVFGATSNLAKIAPDKVVEPTPVEEPPVANPEPATEAPEATPVAESTSGDSESEG